MSKEKIKLKQELNRLRRQKNILWAGILFLVAILFWTSVSIFTSQKKVKIDQHLADLAKPLVPRLDAAVFSMIEEKRVLSDEELSDFPIFVYLTSELNQEGVSTDITNMSSNIQENDEENGEFSLEEEFAENEELVVNENTDQEEVNQTNE